MPRSVHVLASMGTLALAVAFVVPGSFAFSVTGDSLSSSTSDYQRDIRVINNALDVAANDNQVEEPMFAGSVGAPLAIRKAAAAWSSADPNAGKNFDFDWQGLTGAGGSNDNLVTWSNVGVCGGGVQAFLELPSSDGWRLTLCETFTWSDGPGAPLAGQIDIQGIVTHELGHALGLGHSNDVTCGSCPDAPTMCPFLTCPIVEARTIEPDDAAGVAFVYGEAPAGKPVIDALLPGPGGAIEIVGAGFDNFVHVKFTAGTSDNALPIPGVVTNVPSLAGGTRVQVSPPGVAQVAGNVMIWEPSTGLLSNAFPYDLGVAPPQVTAVTPPQVDAVGNELVLLTGSGLFGAGEVSVGGVTLTPGEFEVIDDGRIEFVAPVATALGPANVTVTTLGGQSNGVAPDLRPDRPAAAPRAGEGAERRAGDAALGRRPRGRRALRAQRNRRDLPVQRHDAARPRSSSSRFPTSTRSGSAESPPRRPACRAGSRSRVRSGPSIPRARTRRRCARPTC